MDWKNPVLWDVKTDRLNEIAFSIYVDHINKINEGLYSIGEDKRSSYQPLSDFLKYDIYNKDVYLEDAKVLIRKEKIEKIWKKNKPRETLDYGI